MRGYVPFVLLLLGIALVLRVNVLFTVVYVLLAIYILTRLWVGQMRRNIEVSQHVTDRLFPGDHLHIDVAVTNQGWLPIPWIEVYQSFPTELTSPLSSELFMLSSYARHVQRFSLRVRRRGYYNVGPLDISFGDVFNIIPAQRLRTGLRSVIVYPTVVPIDQLGLPTRSPVARLRSPTALFEDSSRLMGVREYQAGDSPRQIHWSASAHSGSLLVKRYQPAIARETLICLDMSRTSYQRERYYDSIEIAVTVAASLANHIIVHEKQPAGLVTSAIDPLVNLREIENVYLPPRGEHAHLMQMLEILARIQSIERSVIERLTRNHLHLKFGTTLAIVTGLESRELYNMLIPLTRAGYPIALILVQPDGAPRPVATTPRGVNVYRVADTGRLRFS
jgi:uncharacterized protein (DUF58 family)